VLRIMEGKGVRGKLDVVKRQFERGGKELGWEEGAGEGLSREPSLRAMMDCTGTILRLCEGKEVLLQGFRIEADYDADFAADTGSVSSSNSFYEGNSDFSSDGICDHHKRKHKNGEKSREHRKRRRIQRQERLFEFLFAPEEYYRMGRTAARMKSLLLNLLNVELGNSYVRTLGDLSYFSGLPILARLLLSCNGMEFITMLGSLDRSLKLLL